MNRIHIDRDFEHEARVMISVAEAGWRGSPCWHVFDWLAWKMQMKYPLVSKRNSVIGWDKPVL